MAAGVGELKASGPDLTESGAVGPFQIQTAICKEVVVPPSSPHAHVVELAFPLLQELGSRTLGVRSVSFHSKPRETGSFWAVLFFFRC